MTFAKRNQTTNSQIQTAVQSGTICVCCCCCACTQVSRWALRSCIAWF